MRQRFHKKQIAGFSVLLFLTLIFSLIGCDFQSPASFTMPTWFVDIKFPLVTDSYPMSNIVDDSTFFATSDSSGIQLLFNGDLPSKSIDASYLQIPINTNIASAPDPVSSPSLSVVMDTVINISVPIAPSGLIDTNNIPFDLPAVGDKVVSSSVWNQLAAAFDTTAQIDINLPEISSDQLPAFVSSVDAIIITADDGSDSSMFYTSIKNNGIPTSVIHSSFRLLTDTHTPLDTLASHPKDSVATDVTYDRHTLLGGDSLGSAIRIEFGFGIAPENGASTVTIHDGDSVRVNFAIRLRIAGVSDAVVTLSETDMSPDLPAIAFPSDVELYSGVFANPTGLDINEIYLSNLRSTFPFDINFSMNFRNFIPPAGSDSVKIDTVLSSSQSSAITKYFNIDGYTFSNPVSPDSALTELKVDISAVVQAQQIAIPLDGSELGRFTISIQVNEFDFESLQANLIQAFPPTNQSISGMPQGFTGMTFNDVRIEFVMLNQIQLPVVLDMTLKGVNDLGDSTTVHAVGTLGSPTVSGDTVKTILRLSKDGTTSLVYASPSDSTYTDSTTVPPAAGESTIVDFLASNPKDITVESAARIDGRGTIEVGASISGGYRLIAPFAVTMEPMTFIPVNRSPLAPMDNSTRNRIRTSLVQADIGTDVTNHLPFGGEIDMLSSNRALFPLDLTTTSLRTFKDSLVSQEGWNPADSLYYVSNCVDLNPQLGTLYIFDVMNDYSDCVDGMVYLVRSTGSGVDTVISYVDTLVSIILPDPGSYVSDTSSTSVPGSVVEPGFISHVASIDTNKVRLITDYGNHYIVPRFHLNGSNGAGVYFSLNDYLGIESTITFRISSTGMLENPSDELVVLYPNGGETLNINSDYIIRWKTYGTIDKVNLDYTVGAHTIMSNPDIWNSIAAEIANVDSFLWTPVTTSGISALTLTQTDSLRIRVSDAASDVNDISGYYFHISSSSGRSSQAGQKAATINLEIHKRGER